MEALVMVSHAVSTHILATTVHTTYVSTFENYLEATASSEWTGASSYRLYDTATILTYLIIGWLLDAIQGASVHLVVLQGTGPGYLQEHPSPIAGPHLLRSHRLAGFGFIT